jgi:hypothetical protein
MSVGYFMLDTWLNTMLKEAVPDEILSYEFRIFRNEDYRDAETADEEISENKWDLQLVGLGESVRPVFSTRNDFYTFEADMDWDDPMEIITDCVLKYICDGKYAKLLLSAQQGIYVSMPECGERKSRIY